MTLKSDQLISAIKNMIEFKDMCGPGKFEAASLHGPGCLEPQQTTPVTTTYLIPWNLSPPQSPVQDRQNKLRKS